MFKKFRPDVNYIDQMTQGITEYLIVNVKHSDLHFIYSRLRQTFVSVVL